MFEIKESEIETDFVNLCVQQGWLCEKFTSPGKRGVPDRIVTVGPYGFVCFVELKKPGEKPRPLQRLDHETRRRKGCLVLVADSKYQVREAVAKIREEAMKHNGCYQNRKRVEIFKGSPHAQGDTKKYKTDNGVL